MLNFLSVTHLRSPFQRLQIPELQGASKPGSDGMVGSIWAKLATYSQPPSANKGETEARHSSSSS